MQIQVEFITPEIAEKYLATSRGNVRTKTNQARLKRYVLQMKRGEWVPTHQGIAFDEEKRLFDGHHTLSAVIMAGIRVPITVVRGVPVAAVKYTDQNAPRSIDDLLAMGAGTGGILSAMFCRVSNHKRSNITNSDWKELGDKHKDALDFSRKAFNSGQRFPKGVKNTLVAGIVARAWYSAPPDRLLAFVEVLSSGITRDPKDAPAIKVRDLLQNPKKVHRAMRYLYLENGLWHFVNGIPMPHLKAAVRELFPIPDDQFEAGE